LQVGDTYPFEFEMIASRNTSDRWRSEGTVAVVRWEDVSVPAKKFRALKLEAKNTYRGLTGNFSGWARREIWYAPEVKRWVKFSYEDGATGRSVPNNKSHGELLEFKLQ